MKNENKNKWETRNPYLWKVSWGFFAVWFSFLKHSFLPLFLSYFIHFLISFSLPYFLSLCSRFLSPFFLLFSSSPTFSLLFYSTLISFWSDRNTTAPDSENIKLLPRVKIFLKKYRIKTIDQWGFHICASVRTCYIYLTYSTEHFLLYTWIYHSNKDLLCISHYWYIFLLNA